MKRFTVDDLEQKDAAELAAIAHDLKAEIELERRRRYDSISKILFYQDMLEKERARNQK